MKTLFMEKSYVLASIFLTKHLHFREEFVTLEECNVISNALQQEFNKKDLDAIITDTIDNEYYKIVDDVIFINKKNGFDLESLMHRYQGYLLSRTRVVMTLWDDNFMLQQLKKMRN